MIRWSTHTFKEDLKDPTVHALSVIKNEDDLFDSFVTLYLHNFYNNILPFYIFEGVTSFILYHLFKENRYLHENIFFV